MSRINIIEQQVNEEQVNSSYISITLSVFACVDVCVHVCVNVCVYTFTYSYNSVCTVYVCMPQCTVHKCMLILNLLYMMLRMCRFLQTLAILSLCGRVRECSKILRGYNICMVIHESVLYGQLVIH